MTAKDRVNRPVIAALMALTLSVAGCGGGGDDDSSSATPAAVPKSCSDLNASAISSTAIGLPTGGATVATAVSMAASGTGNGTYGAYCLISGDIKPVDQSAPNIKFQIAMPETWNGKVLMLGGFGFDGSIPTLINSSTLWYTQSAPVALGRGYAVFGSDGGHQAPAAGVSPGAFGSNAEALRNYFGDALKKTRDVSVALITSRYGKAPSRSYFMGYSRGGGEALTVTQRWPADWDGVVSGAPGWNVTAVAMQMLGATQAVAAPGAWLSLPKRNLLYRAALSSCDALDGASDGVINNVRDCAARFDPSSAVLNGTPLRCAGGTDTGDTCLSDVQLAALKQINEPTRLSYTLASGETSLPGFPVYISDNGSAAGPAAVAPIISLLGVYGPLPPTFPSGATSSSAWSQADNFIRFDVLFDATYNPLTLNLGTGSGLAPSFINSSALDSNVTDLTPFMNRGGKLIIYQGTSDMLISPRATEFYYSRVQASMGPARVDSFLRYYEIAGAQHGYSSIFDPQFDALTALENWVEQGTDPANTLVVTDVTNVPGRSRPMCVYPTWAKYKGSGDINSAASYTCAAA